MHKGKLIFEYFDKFTKNLPHIIFSISKSLSLLFGIIQKYKINLNSQVCYYIPELTNTAYKNATIRNVLDMNVSSDFIEDYSGEAEIFKKIELQLVGMLLKRVIMFLMVCMSF